MNLNDEVEKEENKLDESSLTDLSPADEQAESTQGGKGLNGNLQIAQFYHGDPS